MHDGRSRGWVLRDVRRNSLNRTVTQPGTRAAITITMGTIAGQACAVAVLPVVSRHFSPEDMGYFSAMVAAIGVVAPVVCLHYELAIPLQRSARAASGLLHLSLGMAVVVALLGSVILIKGAPLILASPLRSSRRTGTCSLSCSCLPGLTVRC